MKLSNINILKKIIMNAHKAKKLTDESIKDFSINTPEIKKHYYNFKQQIEIAAKRGEYSIEYEFSKHYYLSKKTKRFFIGF